MRLNWLMAQHTCTVNPPDRTETNQSPAPAPPSLPDYLPTSPISLHSASSHRKCHRIQIYSKQSQISFNLRFDTNCVHVHRQNTNILIRHFICKFAVRIEWQRVYNWGCYKVKKGHPPYRLYEAESCTLFKISFAILYDTIIWWEKKQGIGMHTV